jgi:hypothetical protein
MLCINGRRVLHCKARGEPCACGLQPADDRVEEGVLRRHVVGHMDSSPHGQSFIPLRLGNPSLSVHAELSFPR